VFQLFIIHIVSGFAKTHIDAEGHFLIAVLAVSSLDVFWKRNVKNKVNYIQAVRNIHGIDLRQKLWTPSSICAVFL